MRNRWAKFGQLSGQERRLLAQALVMLPLTGVALRWLGLRRWHSAFAKLGLAAETYSEGQAQATFQRARVSAKLVQEAAKHGLYRGSCLEQSLVLWWLLQRQGIRSNLRIGVRKKASRLEAHAWVEVLDLVLNDAGDVRQRFTALESAIPASRLKIP